MEARSDTNIIIAGIFCYLVESSQQPISQAEAQGSDNLCRQGAVQLQSHILNHPCLLGWDREEGGWDADSQCMSL